MTARLKKFKKNRFRNFSPDYSFNAPPYDSYSAFQPGGYYRMYHRVEAEKMKRSHDWLKSMLMSEKANSITKTNKSLKEIPLVKTYVKKGVLNVEIGEYNKESLEKFPIISQVIEEGILKVELGDENNKKVVYIDLKGIWSIMN